MGICLSTKPKVKCAQCAEYELLLSGYDLTSLPLLPLHESRKSKYKNLLRSRQVSINLIYRAELQRTYNSATYVD